MKAAYERDKDVYVFAALHNDAIIADPETGKLLEEQLGWTDRINRINLEMKYIQHFERLRKKYSGMRRLEDGWLKTNATYYGWLKESAGELYDERLKRIEETTSGLQTKLSEFERKAQTFQANFRYFLWLLWLAAIVAVFFMWHPF